MPTTATVTLTAADVFGLGIAAAIVLYQLNYIVILAMRYVRYQAVEEFMKKHPTDPAQELIELNERFPHDSSRDNSPSRTKKGNKGRGRHAKSDSDSDTDTDKEKSGRGKARGVTNNKQRSSDEEKDTGGRTRHADKERSKKSKSVPSKPHGSSDDDDDDNESGDDSNAMVINVNITRSKKKNKHNKESTTQKVHQKKKSTPEPRKPNAGTPRQSMPSILSRYTASTFPRLPPTNHGLTLFLHQSYFTKNLVFGWTVYQMTLAAIYVAFTCLVLFALWPTGSDPRDTIGMKTGWLAVINSALIAVSATRWNVLTALIGIPFERMLRFHRFSGRLIVAFAVAHGILEIWVASASVTTTSGSDWIAFFADVQNWSGVAAVAALLLLAVSSINSVRRYHFDTFYLLHHVAFLAYFIFTGIHLSTMGSDKTAMCSDLCQYFVMVGPGIFFYGADITIRAMTLWRRLRVLDVKSMGCGVLRIRFGIPDAVFAYTSGQYVFLRTAAVSAWRTHPFTIDSSPIVVVPPLAPGAPLRFSKVISLHVKNVGDHTKQLYALAEAVTARDPASATLESPDDAKDAYRIAARKRSAALMQPWTGSLSSTRSHHTIGDDGADGGGSSGGTTDWVSVQGPFGVLPFDMTSMQVAVLCSGGIGVTPMVSLVLTLSYAMRARRSGYCRKVYFVWSIRTEEEYEWFAEELRRIDQVWTRKSDDDDDDDNNDNEGSDTPEPLVQMLVHVTAPPGDSLTSDFFLSGRPKYKRIFQDIAKKHKCDVGVAACGPVGLLDSVRQACIECSSAQGLFYLHEETFNF